MPLLKLWNALCGRSNGDQSVSDQPVDAKPAPANSRVAQAASGGFSLFGGNPYSALCKKVAKTGASSVLEIAVGDGSRAIAIHECLTKKGGQVRYYGIDQFEAAGGSNTLKDFHRTLRAANVRAQIFPESVNQALVRFLHTVGSVDLVLISSPEGVVDDPVVQQLLARISHPGTQILYQKGDVWAEYAAQTMPLRRAA